MNGCGLRAAGAAVMREFVLTSVEDGSTLRLSYEDRSWGTLTAEASGPGFSVHVPVYIDLSASLPEFFRHLQSTPNTGQKELSWGTLEGEFKLDATLDALGHIFIVYRLRSPDIGSSRWWSFTGRLVLELGNLPEVCKRLEHFWGAAT